MSYYDPTADVSMFKVYAQQAKTKEEQLEEKELEKAKTTQKYLDFGTTAYNMLEGYNVDQETKAMKMTNISDKDYVDGKKYKWKDSEESKGLFGWLKSKRTKAQDRVELNPFTDEAKKRRMGSNPMSSVNIGNKDSSYKTGTGFKTRDLTEEEMSGFDNPMSSSKVDRGSLAKKFTTRPVTDTDMDYAKTQAMKGYEGSLGGSTPAITPDNKTYVESVETARGNVKTTTDRLDNLTQMKEELTDNPYKIGTSKPNTGIFKNLKQNMKDATPMKDIKGLPFPDSKDSMKVADIMKKYKMNEADTLKYLKGAPMPTVDVLGNKPKPSLDMGKKVIDSVKETGRDLISSIKNKGRDALGKIALNTSKDVAKDVVKDVGGDVAKTNVPGIGDVQTALSLFDKNKSGGEKAYDLASAAAMKINPLVGGGMKAGKLLWGLRNMG